MRKLTLADRCWSSADVAAVCRELGVSEQTYHRWRDQFRRLKAGDARLSELFACRVVVQQRSAHRRKPSSMTLANPNAPLRDWAADHPPAMTVAHPAPSWAGDLSHGMTVLPNPTARLPAAALRQRRAGLRPNRVAAFGPSLHRARRLDTPPDASHRSASLPDPTPEGHALESDSGHATASAAHHPDSRSPARSSRNRALTPLAARTRPSIAVTALPSESHLRPP